MNWDAVGAALDGLAATAPDHPGALERLARVALDPLIRLERVGELTERAAAGDRHAQAELGVMLREVGAGGLVDGDGDPPRPGSNASAAARWPADAAGVLDEGSLTRVALQLTDLYGERREAGPGALDALLALVRGGAVMDGIARAWERSGTAGLLEAVRRSLERLPVGDGDLERDPGVPIPGSGRELVDSIRRPELWDLEWWERIPPWWVEEVPTYDPPEGLDCLFAVSQLMSARSALLPPIPPPGALFADPIASLSATGSCGGDTLRIEGSGLAPLRTSAKLLLPTHEGCRIANVPASDWTDTTITVRLPDDVASGPVGFVDAAFVDAYREWEAEQNRLLEELRSYPCFPDDPAFGAPRPFSQCPPDLGRNHLRAGAPLIVAFTANGLTKPAVRRGEPIVLSWTTRNAESIELRRSSAEGPGFGTAPGIAGLSAIGSHALGPAGGDRPASFTYELRAVGPCGERTATVTVLLREVPRLTIKTVELTQGIQTSGEEKRIPLIAAKDTIVRVFVEHDLADFEPEPFGSGGVELSGEVRIAGQVPPLQPLNPLGAAAQPPNRGDRTKTDHSLNFKVSMALANAPAVLAIKVWTRNEFEQAPAAELVKPRAQVAQPISWQQKRPLKLRYVRVSTPASPAPEDGPAREAITRAFHLLPTPPLDIEAARVPIWHTSADALTEEGKSMLLAQLDDQHDCSTFEEFLPWDDDSCPDDDGAIWIGVGTGIGGGLAQRWRPDNESRNTAVAELNPVTIAHELGHCLRLNHVNPNLGCSAGLPEGDYDSLPGNGAVRIGDAFDPDGAGHVVGTPPLPLWDVMTYGCERWTSPTTWWRLAWKF